MDLDYQLFRLQSVSSEKRSFIIAKVAGGGHEKWLSNIKKKENSLFLVMSLPQMWKHEGFFALYKGFWPNWLRLGPWNIIVSF